MDIYNHWLQQEASRGVIKFNYTLSYSIVADGLIKALNSLLY